LIHWELHKFLTIIKSIILLSIIFLTITKVNATTANCSGGECEFNYSHHYSYVKTNCFQNLSFEEVETELSYFKILKTGQKCEVFEITE